ncbi:hypothetical protein [Sandaracinus amylolyticus]|uniref:hypothetical protein n=1 Tax=Sandaracinus amylolyticus TaxID=927083 RepID=UPI001F336CF3|nr:hypothetical protein [Sandaracinus amylolyticus]UJR85274.1 Hypothetical protein I5071_73540 [Sandaracinus amylolyticus]
MGDAVDDERVARWTLALRRIAFALVVIIGSAIVIHGCACAATEPSPDFDTRAWKPPPVWYAWAAACATGVLAWWLAGHRRDVVFSAGLAMFGGAVNSPLACFVIGIADGISTGRLDALARWCVYATLGSIIGMPIGAVVGAFAGAALVPLALALERVAQRPTISSMPRAVCIAAAWTTLGAGVIAVVSAQAAALGLAVIAALVLVVACAELARRRWRARAIERGGIAGWSIERDDDGTRWLVRETLAGDGAYREGALRVRWGRLDG